MPVLDPRDLNFPVVVGWVAVNPIYRIKLRLENFSESDRSVAHTGL